MAKKPQNENPESPATVATELKYGNLVADISNLPEVSRVALMQRGFTHILGNEVASKVAAWKKTEDGSTADEAAIARKTANYQDEALEKILDGKLGIRAGGPRGTAIETVMRVIAIAELKANFKKAGAKWPEKADSTIKVRDRVLTRTALVGEYMSKHGARLKSDAEARASAEASQVVNLDDLV